MCEIIIVLLPNDSCNEQVVLVSLARPELKIADLLSKCRFEKQGICEYGRDRGVFLIFAVNRIWQRTRLEVALSWCRSGLLFCLPVLSDLFPSVCYVYILLSGFNLDGILFKLCQFLLYFLSYHISL